MKKLKLKREVIASMSKESMNNIVGGQLTSFIGDCITIIYPTIDTPCETVQKCIAIKGTSLCQ